MNEQDSRDPKNRLKNLSTPSRKPISRWMENTLEKALALPEVHRVYAKISGDGSETDFIRDALEEFQIRVEVSEKDFKRIPGKGPLIVVANRPFGMIEGLVVSSILLGTRQDVKIMANPLLAHVEEIQDLFFFIDPEETPESTRKNIRVLRESFRWISDGACLTLFPASDVSHFQWKAMKNQDPTWNDSAARIIKKTGASVLPIFFVGGNSPLFHMSGMIHPRLRTALLPREFAKKQGKEIHVKIGKPIPSHHFNPDLSAQDITSYLRFRTYLLEHRKEEDTSSKKVDLRQVIKKRVAEEIEASASKESLLREIQGLPEKQKLVVSGNQEVYVGNAKQLPLILREIGRLREVTFRKVGEGTGKKTDLDRYDDFYLHLFVWNAKENEVVGAYRLGDTQEILSNHGVKGFYTHQFFSYGEGFIEKMQPGYEMGRSFVREEYQKSFWPLLMLWKGIGALICADPDRRFLFGPVSISSDYSRISREILVDALCAQEFDSELAKLVKPKRPLKGKKILDFGGLNIADFIEGLDDLSDLISDVETKLEGIPVLLKQYLKLGGKLTGFNVDHDFNDALDGLIVVDVKKSNPKALKTYMGKEGFAKFAAHHGIKI